jgi:hypothetical protein
MSYGIAYMKKPRQILKLFVISFGLLATASVHATELIYKKSLSLFVIHDFDQGKSESLALDTSVGNYVVDAGSVLYVKGRTLYLIPDTRKPKAVLVVSGVADFKLKDGLIAYSKGDSLYVRRLSEDIGVSSRQVSDSQGVSSMDIAGDTIVFLKNQSALYRVIDYERGTSERVIYPVGEAQVSAR